ncbi:hypothetical protein [Ahrensia sp. 13_GOM-1096m]|nr:hypothetical protein [Ahrensia sp. 13_GOM-1096m]
MAKGQIRGNKEARKPKKEKVTAVAAPVSGGLKIGAASPMNAQPKKK